MLPTIAACIGLPAVVVETLGGRADIGQDFVVYLRVLAVFYVYQAPGELGLGALFLAVFVPVASLVLRLFGGKNPEPAA